jgi:hypothetical protein
LSQRAQPNNRFASKSGKVFRLTALELAKGKMQQLSRAQQQ